MDFLKEILGETLFEQVFKAINEYNGNEANKDKQVKIGNLASGEYALKGNGRKTKWKYKHPKYGWVTTTGKAPSRALEKAKNSSKKKIQARAEEIFGDIGK